MAKIGQLGDPGKRDEYFKQLADQLETFLLYLQDHPSDLLAFIDDRVALVNKPRFKEMLSDQAKAILLQSDYSIVQEVMSYRTSTAVRWVCVWVI
jgi:hypothetical protein